MKTWEFLIQKRGDDCWLPIQELREIEVGTYRIVAQTQRVNAEVEIRITYYGKVAHSQKCRRLTNAQGLVAIVPFTDFQPGLWEIDCCGDLMDELMGESWQESLQLHVVSAEATTIEPAPHSDGDEAWELVSVIEFEPPAALPPEELEQPEGEVVEPRLELTLYQDTFVKGSEPILLSGRVDVSDAEGAAPWQLCGGRLRYKLRDPRTAKVLFDAEQPLSEQALPLIFSYTLELKHWDTCVLLGEVALEVAQQDESAFVPIARRTFTITANANELLPSGGFDVQKLRLQSAGTLRRISLFDPTRSRANRILRSRPSSGQVLPPKINTQASSRRQEPQLPKFRVQLASVAKNWGYPYPAVYESSASDDALAADQAFEALNLQERFWSRLSSLTDPGSAEEDEVTSAEEESNIEAAEEATQE